MVVTIVCAVASLWVGGMFGMFLASLFSYRSYSRGYNDALREAPERMHVIGSPGVPSYIR